MSILITGATGFIGTHLIKHIKNPIILPKEKLTKDLTDDLKDADVVIHLATPFSTKSGEEAKDLDVEITKNLIEASKKKGIKQFIYFSSVVVTGKINNQEIDEDSPYMPYDPYSLAKCENEGLVKNSGLVYTIIRPAIVYGPYDKKNIYRMFKKINNNSYKIIGRGDNILALVYVENLVEAVKLIINNKRAFNQTFIVSDEPSSYNKITSLIAKLLDKKKPIHVPPFIASIIVRFSNKDKEAVKYHTSDQKFKTDKLKSWGYKQKYTLKEGLKKTIQWYKENNLL